MVELPADVQAALDAYLAARGDDATWAAYVNRLGPGVALDVATDLCLWTTADADAVAWIRRDFESTPEDWNDPQVPEPALGLTRYSASFQTFLDGEPTYGSYTITLERQLVQSDGHNPWHAVHSVSLASDDWETCGVYRLEESLAEYARIDACALGELAQQQRVDVWAVAACRAACLSWAPDWARSQEKR